MERNELRLNSKRRQRENDLQIQNQDRKPRKQQKRLSLTKELNNAMQDRQWKSPSIQEDLESIRKFSILRCIRERVFEELSKLPLLSLECLVQKEKDIDGLIRRNLLKERKVRFSADDEYEGEPKIQKTEDEIEKENILEEMDVVLKILGNDSQNKLIIENFDLLEERIERVEQRLSGLVRKLPYRIEKLNNRQIKIDIKHVRQDIQNFVNKFNQVFSKDYGVLPNTSAFKCLPKQTFSSTHRLKFQMLSRIMEEDANMNSNFQDLKTLESLKQEVIETAPEINATKQLSSEADTQQSVEKMDSQMEQSSLKAVDSLITLRERFKAQSLKWLKIKSDKKTEPPKILTQTKVEELYLSSERKKVEDTHNTNLQTQELEISKEMEAAKIDLITDEEEEQQNEQSTKNDESSFKPVSFVENNQKPNENLLKTVLQRESITAFKNLNINNVLKNAKETNNLDRATKSVQTITKMKKRRLKRKPKLLQPEEAKEIVVQYVNKKVLRNNNSTAEFEEWKAMKDKEFMLKNEKENSKLENKQQTKIKPNNNTNNKPSKEPNNTSNCSKVIFQNTTKESVNKKQENLTSNSKRYKKIFLFKLPKSNSKQQTKILQKKIELKDSNDLKESPNKKVIEKSTKKTSIIKLFPKASRVKSLREEKSAKEKKLQKPGIKTSISSDSIDKVPTIEQIRKLRSTWIYAEDQGELVQKRLDDFNVYTDPTLSNNMKNRKSINKNKKN